MGCLELIWREAGAAGGDPEDLLLPYQARLYRDLRSGIDEQALAHLYDWWEYDRDALFARGRDWNRDLPAKPRIDLHLELSSKGNLKCEWRPTGIDQWGYLDSPSANPDFTHWYRMENRSGGWDSRPSNELFFLHDLEHCLITIKGRRLDARPIYGFDQVLLQCTSRLVTKLKHRLEPHFDVTMASDLFLSWDPPEHRLFRGTDRLIGFEIDSPARREEEAERAEFKAAPSKYGFSFEHFEGAWADSLKKPKSGPSPTVEQAPVRVAKMLRNQGHSEVTQADVRRLRYLADKFGPKQAEIIPFERAPR